jgi:GNAT superfamily N-acetyltransferase
LTVKPPFPRRQEVGVTLSDHLVDVGLSLRHAIEADCPFLQTLFASFQVEEMRLISWPQEQKYGFLSDQFRLQHHHFVSYFPDADFWIVERSHQTGVSPVGRLYLDRSTPLWRIIDIGFLPETRGQGFGSALLKWAKACASDAGAAGIDLHVLVANERALALYRRLGFEIEESQGYHLRLVWRRSV